jgi:hypothetical protein
MPATPQTAPKTPWMRARSAGLKMSPMIVIATGCSPPAPTPWTARNAMSWSIVCERPLAIEPARKAAIPTSMMGLRP